MTGDLFSRVTQHKEAKTPGFTQKYGVHMLVWHEGFSDIHAAIQRERTMKKWPRQWKINLIERDNPNWVDLHLQML